LNFTLALALVTVVMIQVMGVQAHGIGYFNKFINIRAMRENPKSGLIQVFVGILELIGEIAKIASFGFRLFGNMFAGMVLLSFLGYMVPWLVNAFIMLYEAFVGILQAFIFAMLAAVFMSMAVRSEHSSS
jgi:F-type H+-transporting ATPase subunit a